MRISKGFNADDSKIISYSEYKNRQYDELADILRNSLDMDMIYEILHKEI